MQRIGDNEISDGHQSLVLQPVPVPSRRSDEVSFYAWDPVAVFAMFEVGI
jgi:hypothetical protein